MPNTQGYVDYILELLERVAPVTPRRMFGALGIYTDGTFFAIVDDDTLYFKVDDASRQQYIDAGSPPFMPNGMASKGYFQVPAGVLEDDRALAEWMCRSIAAARAPKQKRRR